MSITEPNKGPAVGIIIQARTNSTRLPRKVVLPFYQNKNILEILIEKTKVLGLPIILATSDSEQDSFLKTIADEHRILFFQGSERDVLKRFIDAADLFKIDVIIRVCADNPFLHPPYLQAMVDSFKEKPADYISHATPTGKPVIQTHYGFFAELVTVAALKKVSQRNPSDLYREHVTNYIYAFPDEFDIHWLEFPFKEPEQGVRFTVDTEDDFKLISELFAKYKDHSPPEIIDIISNDRDVMERMGRQITLNTK